MKKIKHYNIMLVEDEVLLRQSLARHIDALEMGYKVVCQVPDGQAALDALAEEQIYRDFDGLVQGKTAIYISHRLASTRFCDRILLMENGEVAEAGTHEELLAKGESYARMYRIQSKYYQQAQAGLEGDMIL